ncbi:unnamed protein product [Urochloa decumbens]|uniref:F-box domain-containing protein n=1 Tax=Urochloa decumbens TaxID=240449 RepID=A0ABC9GC12_9POAL
MDMDELVEGILLRVPPDDPVRLVLASLVCKRWRRIISDPGFDRRFRPQFMPARPCAAWSERASALLDDHITLSPSVLVGNALYFLLDYDASIMKYDLGTREMTVIEIRLECVDQHNVLMTTEDGGLGFAYVEKYGLQLWSMMEAGPNGDVGWAKT